MLPTWNNGLMMCMFLTAVLLEPFTPVLLHANRILAVNQIKSPQSSQIYGAILTFYKLHDRCFLLFKTKFNSYFSYEKGEKSS